MYFLFFFTVIAANLMCMDQLNLKLDEKPQYFKWELAEQVPHYHTI
jgi:hypothetical protein